MLAVGEVRLVLQQHAGLVVGELQQVRVDCVDRFRVGDAGAQPGDHVVSLDALHADLRCAERGQEALGPGEQLVALLDLDRAFHRIPALLLVLGEVRAAVLVAHVVGNEQVARGVFEQDWLDVAVDEALGCSFPAREVAAGLFAVHRLGAVGAVVGVLHDCAEVEDGIGRGHGVISFCSTRAAQLTGYRGAITSSHWRARTLISSWA
ncbi:hypothetical protein D9M69_529020 [compost metagenome]